MRKPWFSLSDLVLLVIVGAIFWAITRPQRVYKPEANVRAALSQLKAFATGLDLFKADNGFYPRSSDGLNALVAKPSETLTNWHPYMESIPVDPWGNAYIYACPGVHRPDSYDLSSAGPDGRAGTADDITNWQPTGR